MVAREAKFGYLAAHGDRSGALRVFPHGSSEKEGLEVSAKHAAIASRAVGGELRRMPELRRNEAAASFVLGVRSL
jgi:hypothetical protein